MPDFLSKISDAISYPTSGSGSGVVGIDFSSSAVKVVQIRRKEGSPVLQTYGELSYAPYVDKSVGETVKATPEVITDALSDIIKEAKVTTNSAGAAIPLSSSLLNIIDLPPGTSDKDLSEVVPIEARKYIPADPDEVMLDWTLVGDESQNKDGGPQQALVVAIHEDAISQYQEAVENTDLNVGFFEIEVFSSIRATLDRGIEPVMLLDMGTSATKMYIVEHGVVRGSHRVDQGGEHITRTLANNLDISFSEAEKIKRKQGLNGEGEDAELVKESAHNVLDHVFSRAEEIIEDYQEENQKVVKEVILTGGGAVLSGVSEAASDIIGVEARLADPFSKLQTPEFLEDTLTDIGPEFAVAIGAAMRQLRES
jgi:type IV pilus assembly protein PilM